MDNKRSSSVWHRIKCLRRHRRRRRARRGEIQDQLGPSLDFKPPVKRIRPRQFPRSGGVRKDHRGSQSKEVERSKALVAEIETEVIRLTKNNDDATSPRSEEQTTTSDPSERMSLLQKQWRVAPCA